jgi:3-(methylthio)propionyl---CoA ligase
MLAWFVGKIAKWWIPEAVEFIDGLPHTATGKVQKVALREVYKDFTFAE